ncbi:MAG: hypothetical protein R3B54_10400 [Bdellovibrionota bacterium]
MFAAISRPALYRFRNVYIRRCGSPAKNRLSSLGGIERSCIKGDFVIPYELRIHNRNGAISRYSIIVSLADHFRYYFGPQDGLSHFLAGNEFHGQHEYLNYVFEWYLNMLPVSEGIYADGAHAIAEETETRVDFGWRLRP